MDGVLNLDKPPGISSARAVGIVKRLIPRGVKIGHAGTLDPFATGVLLLLVGKATRSCEAVMDQPKQYDATVRLGATTATDDPESELIPWPNQFRNVESLSRDAIAAVTGTFIGRTLQTPPAFSALKVNGQRAYKLARNGNLPIMTPRAVMIYSIELVDYAWPLINLKVDCGRGTYIRALARDIGEALDLGGHLSQLRRTRVGPYSIDSSTSLQNLTAENIERQLIPV